MHTQENHAMQRLIRLGVAAAAAALLAACGGGSNDHPETPAPPTTPTDTVPDSATASVRAYTEFAAQLVANTANSETAAPLMLNAASAPLSEIDSPLPVD
ncbi:hypothetical protein AQPW35_21030 [Rubrivivax pictus]|uniref:Uncharacterized protein n=2 Tax=Pseudaquabacterium pictum TaxID=2315236 RepID=A0A480ASH1_9BURK|nr:hypothetical protein AQPW35_21030 [Rubrivivax pictus]